MQFNLFFFYFGQSLLLLLLSFQLFVNAWLRLKMLHSLWYLKK